MNRLGEQTGRTDKQTRTCTIQAPLHGFYIQTKVHDHPGHVVQRGVGEPYIL